MNDRGIDGLRTAAELLAQADALFIGAGAGMGVDSGLPDFRGREGFWRAYPPYAKLGLDFASIANPRWFRDDPSLAWGFYGHRMHLYRVTTPHRGFTILRRWAERTHSGSFVFTSNVDGQFQRAGFDPDRVVEIHGSIERMQCSADCGFGLFPASAYEVTIDHSTMRAAAPLPTCPRCGSLARPNILMFGDSGWDSSETDAQMSRFRAWLDTLDETRLVAIECGAGTAIPTVRRMCESLAGLRLGTLIRINPRDFQVPALQISLRMGALDGLCSIDDALTQPPISFI